MYRGGSRIRPKKFEKCLPAGTGTKICFSRNVSFGNEKKNAKKKIRKITPNHSAKESSQILQKFRIIPTNWFTQRFISRTCFEFCCFLLFFSVFSFLIVFFLFCVHAICGRRDTGDDSWQRGRAPALWNCLLSTRAGSFSGNFWQFGAICLTLLGSRNPKVFFRPTFHAKSLKPIFCNFNGFPPDSRRLSTHFDRFSVIFNQFQSVSISFSQF